MVQNEIKKQNNDKDQEVDDAQTKEMNELKMKYKEALHKNQQLNQQNEQINDQIMSLIVQVPKLFNSLNCQNLENMGTPLEEENINLSNIISILAQIEKKSSEIMEVSNFLSQK